MNQHADWPGPPQQYQPGPGQPQQYPHQSQRPARQRRRWPLATGTGLAGLILGGLIGAAAGGGDDPSGTLAGAQPAAASAPAKAKPAASSKAAAPKSPAGVTVSGSSAGDLTIVSFKAEVDALGSFAPTLRIRNTTGDDLRFVVIKVTALKGEEVAATADGAIESIDAGQTVTVEPISADQLKSVKGLTFDVELGG